MKRSRNFALRTWLVLVLVACIASLPIQMNAQKTTQFRTNGKTFEHKIRSHSNAENDCTAQAFRTIDGTCNNLSTPDRSEWGASDVQLRREIATDYGFPDPYNDMAGQDRPSPRAISNLMSNQPFDVLSKYNLSSFVFTWGQFLDHDITLTPEGHTEYYPVELPANETLFTDDIPFFRSAIHGGTGVYNEREQTNLITSWIDASNVYGSEETRADWLRTFNDGKLKTSKGNLLPFNTIDGDYDSDIDSNAPSMAGDNGGVTKTFVAGDIRAGEQPGLTSLHTLFVREHNRICNQLKSQGINDDEEMYQLARKRVGAMIQAITYQEFLPALGIDISNYQGYRPNVKPDISNFFATAAYRLGHTMVTNELLLRDDDCKAVGEGKVSLIDGFFNPEIIRDNNISPILKGLSMQVQQEVDVYIIDNLRNFLFAVPGVGTFGLDLASLNIQRGRDHGLYDYNAVREHYLGQSAQNFGEITNDPLVRSNLQNIYAGDINNIDPWVGLLAERPLNGKSVGRTLHAILKKQFESLRDGDFFYYENDPFFNNQTVNQIEDTRLSEIMERNTNLKKLNRDVFRADDCRNGNPPNGGGGGGGRPGGGGGGRGNGGGGNIVIEDPGIINSEIFIDGILSVYPNPTQDYVQISISEIDMTSINLKVLNSNGQIVYQENQNNVFDAYHKELELSHLPTGVYIISMQTNQRVYAQKLVIE